MRSVFSLIVLWSAAMLLQGCSGKSLGVGYNETYCDERGCNFQDAGICGDPMEIYKNRKYIQATKAAYKPKEQPQRDITTHGIIDIPTDKRWERR